MAFDPSELKITVTDADARVLEFLLENKHILPSKGVSLNNIVVTNDVDKKIAKVTVNKTIGKFKKNGFIAEGVKCGKAKTYYITEKGIELYTHLFGMSTKRREAITKSIIGVTGCFDEEDGQVDYEAVVHEVLNSQKVNH